MLDEQGAGKSFIDGIRAKEMSGKMEKGELELSSMEESHREQRRKHFQMGN